MRTKLVLSILFVWMVAAASGQSIELLISGVGAEKGATAYTSSITDTWHYGFSPAADYIQGLKPSGNYFVLESLDKQHIYLVNAVNHETTTITPPKVASDSAIRKVVRDEYGRIWALIYFGDCCYTLYHVSLSGELTAYLTFVYTGYAPLVVLEYNDDKLYIAREGEVFRGIDQTTSILTSQGIVVFEVPETLGSPSSFPDSAVSTMPIPWSYTSIVNEFQFDSFGRLYFWTSYFNVTAKSIVARWDGSKWETIDLIHETHSTSPYRSSGVSQVRIAPDDRVILGGQFDTLNHQAVDNITAFTWELNPTFEKLGDGAPFAISSMDMDYADDGTKLNAVYFASGKRIARFDLDTFTVVELNSPTFDGFLLASARSKIDDHSGSGSGSEGSDSGSEGSDSGSGTEDDAIELISFSGRVMGGQLDYVTSDTDVWHTLSGSGGYPGIKTSGSYYIMMTGDQTSFKLLNAVTRQVSVISVSRFAPDAVMLYAVRDAQGRFWTLWIYGRELEYALYLVTEAGEMIGPYLTIVRTERFFLSYLDYNDGKIYIGGVTGAVYLGTQQTTSAYYSGGLVVFDIPEPLERDPDAVPASAVTVTTVPIDLTRVPSYVLGWDYNPNRLLEFDSAGRVYFWFVPADSSTCYIARWDGATWEVLELQLTLPQILPTVIGLFVGANDRIILAGQFDSVNNQPTSYVTAFTWSNNPTFENFGDVLPFPAFLAAADFADDGSRLNAIYISDKTRIGHFYLETGTFKELPLLPVTPPFAIMSTRAKTTDQLPQFHGLVVFGNQTGWIPGSSRYMWGTGGSCGLTTTTDGPSVNKGKQTLMLAVTSGVMPPDDWFGCGQYYYHNHDNTFLDLTGYNAIRFWFRSTAPSAKIEVEFDANTASATPTSINNPGLQDPAQNPKKAFIYKTGTNDYWVQVTLPLTDRTADELAHVYSPFIITLLGYGHAYISDIEAIHI